MSAPSDIVVLRAGTARLEVAPRLGGVILSYWSEMDGARIDWLTPRATSPMPEAAGLALASFPLVPYSNRIRDGRFVFRGRTVTEGVRPGTNWAIHGHGRTTPWGVVELHDDRLTIAYAHAPGDWPWRYRAEQRFVLAEDGLTVTLAVENLSAEDMPAGLGQHPYFPRTPDTSVTAETAGIWQPEASQFPTSFTAPPHGLDPRTGIMVDRVALDHAFAGWTGRAVIDWPERGARLVMTAEPAPATLIVYSPADKDFVCVEPVSHCVDAFNLAAAGVADTGMRVLAPGEAMQLTMTLQPELA